MLPSNRSPLLCTLPRTRYVAFCPFRAAILDFILHMPFAKYHAGIQASDILTAAAPLNLKKQDLLDLESGVSALTHTSAVLHAFVYNCTLWIKALWPFAATVSKLTIGHTFNGIIVQHFSLLLTPWCHCSCLQAQAKVMRHLHGVIFPHLDGSDQSPCWQSYTAWHCFCC